MGQSIGTAVHRYDDGSQHAIRVEIRAKDAGGWPAVIGEPNVFRPRDIDIENYLGIAGARQARVLANWLTLLADRLEARGQM